MKRRFQLLCKELFCGQSIRESTEVPEFPTIKMEDPIIKINVGGKLFSTYRSTLCSKPGTFLSQKFAHPDFFKETKDFFLDRDPLIFGIVLNYYRTGILLLPPKTKLRLFYHELDFYGIDHKESLPDVVTNETRSGNEQSFERPKWKEEYDLYVEIFLRYFSAEVGYSGRFVVPFKFTFHGWTLGNKYVWKDGKRNMFLNIDMGGAWNLNEAVIKSKIHDGSLKEPEKFSDGRAYSDWIKSLVFEEKEVDEIFDNVKKFHDIGFVEVVQKEIVVRLIKLGWKAKIIRDKVKCREHATLITKFDNDHILFDVLCYACLSVFLQDPKKFNKNPRECSTEWELPVLTANL